MGILDDGRRPSRREPNGICTELGIAAEGLTETKFLIGPTVS